jgi:predicted nuclease of predicted toxin-antitoxin system
MRALLDENMPKALVRLFAPEIEARTVQQEGWRGRKNGDLLAVASKSFDLFITTDRGIPHQQNLNRYAIGIVLLETRSNRAEDLAQLVPKVKERLRDLAPGAVIRLSV